MKLLVLILFLGVNTSFAQTINSGELIEYTVTIKSDKYTDCDDIRDNLYSIGRIRWLNHLYNTLISSGSIAYQYSPDADRSDIFKYPLSKKALQNIMISYDTMYLYSSESPDTPQPNIIETPLKIENIQKIRFLEKWEMTSKNGLTKQIVAFAPVINEYNNYDELTGEKVLFWLKPDIINDFKNEILITEWIEYKVPVSKTTNQMVNNWAENILSEVKTGQKTSYSILWDIYSNDSPEEVIKLEDIKKNVCNN
jgi:hypothetical protein